MSPLFPLACIVLQILDKGLLGFPIAPAVSRDESVRQMLLSQEAALALTQGPILNAM
jgi:hypothetical protein